MFNVVFENKEQLMCRLQSATQPNGHVGVGGNGEMKEYHKTGALFIAYNLPPFAFRPLVFSGVCCSFISQACYSDHA